MKPSGTRVDEARRKAQGYFAKSKEQSTAVLKDHQRAQVAEAAKTAKLRELRLAKEAADQQAPPDKKPVTATE